MCNLFIISWCDIHDHSGSGALPIGGRRLTGPAWDACDGLEPEDVATAEGVNMILDTLAEAIQDDYDVDGPHTAHVSQVKEALIEQEEDIELEIALAALEQEGDTDLEETDVQEMPLVCKESRQLRGERQVNCDQEYGCVQRRCLLPAQRCFAGLRPWKVLHWCCVRGTELQFEPCV